MKNTTTNDWEATLTALSQQKNWEEMWRLVTEVPLEWSIRILLWLKEANWQPEREAERATFNNLVLLAEECENGGIGGLVYHLPTPKGAYDDYYDHGDLAMSPDGRMLAGATPCAGRPGGITIWSLPDGNNLFKLAGGNEHGLASCIIFSPDSQILATSWENEHFIRLWNPQDGALLHTLEGHTDMVTCLAFSPDGQILASGSEDQTIRLWNVSDGKALFTLKQPSEGTNYTRIPLFEGEPERGYKIEGGYYAISRLLFSPDGRLLVSVNSYRGESWHRNFHHDWSLPEETLVNPIRLWSLPDGTLFKTLEGHSYDNDTIITCLACSPDGQILVSGSPETVRIWSLPDGELLHTLEMGASRLAISPDSKMLAIANQKSLQLWNLADGTMLHALEESEEFRMLLGFSPDNRVLLCCTDHASVRLWSVPDGCLMYTQKGDDLYSVHVVAIISDWHVLLTYERTARIWLWTLRYTDLSRVCSRQTDIEEFDIFERILRKQQMSGTGQKWLELLLLLMRYNLAKQMARFLETTPEDLPITSEEVTLLRYACQEAESETAFRACVYLLHHQHPEAIDILCARWQATRDPLLTQKILQAGYVARQPLLLRILTALLTENMEIIESCGVDVVDSLVCICEDTDPQLAERAHQVLLNVLKLPDAQERLCQICIEEDSPLAFEITRTQSLAPADPYQRALFYCMTGQWDKYEQLDVDQHLLKTMYLLIKPAVRRRLATRARQTGRLEWVTVAACERQRQDQQPEMTDEEWQSVLHILTHQKNWQEIWRLAQTAPAQWSLKLLLRLKEVGWKPDHPTEQQTFIQLVALAEKCQTTAAETPGGLVHCYATLFQEGEENQNHYLAISPDKRLLASVSDNAVQLWSLPNCEALHSFPHNVVSSYDDAPCRAKFHPDGGNLAIVYRPGNVRLWDVSDGTESITFPNTDYLILFSPDGQLLICYSIRSFQIWSVSEGKLLRTIEISPTEERFGDFTISPDGKILAASIWDDETIRLWNLPDGAALSTLKGHTERVRCIAFSSDSRILASGSEDSSIRLWNMPDGKLLNVLKGHTDQVHCLTVSPDGQFLVSGSYDCTIRVWSLPEGKELHVLPLHDKSGVNFAISPDGRVLAVCTDWNTERKRMGSVICLWNLTDGVLLHTLKLNQLWPELLTFTANGRSLVCGQNRKIQLWDVGLADFRHVNVGQIGINELDLLQKRLQEKNVTQTERTWLEFLLALARWQKRFDVEVGEAPQGIPGREFDVEVISSTSNARSK